MDAMAAVEKNTNDFCVHQAQAVYVRIWNPSMPKMSHVRKSFFVKDRLRKEKAKRMTQKREKQRGCGW